MGDETVRVRPGTRLEGDRVELLGGQLVVAEPQGNRHAATVSLVADAVRPLSGADGCHGSAPGRPRIVEVAESRRTLDRQYKASLDARAGVPEYRVVDI